MLVYGLIKIKEVKMFSFQVDSLVEYPAVMIKVFIIWLNSLIPSDVHSLLPPVTVFHDFYSSPPKDLWHSSLKV